MDSAYDHIQESTLPERNDAAASQQHPGNTLNSDFQEAYKAISSSPWGARLGGFFGNVVKQGENVYKEASQELGHVSQEATKGFGSLRETLVSRTRTLSLAQKDSEAEEGKDKDGAATEKSQESEGVLARLRAEAAKRLKEIEKAEDAADEALLKFGANIRNFLADAVKVAPPADGEQASTVLFESKDSQGKRVIHTTRFDAQLHVIHSSLDSFSRDPEGEEWKSWKDSFDVEKKTDDIAKDLEKYDELRSAMDKLVPGQVTYKDFWTRYYFLRLSIETAEARRRDLLKGAVADAEEEIAWDEDTDDEEDTKAAPTIKDTTSAESSQTINPTPSAPGISSTHLQPVDAKVRKNSGDARSVADSEASYDMVGAKSANTSQGPGSPRAVDAKKAGDDSDDDWE